MLALSLPAPAAGAGPFEIRHSAPRLAVPLGERFVATLEVTNRTAQTRTAHLLFRLERLKGKAPPVTFTSILDVVAARSTVTRRLSVTTSQFFRGRGRFRLAVLTEDGDQIHRLTFRVTEPRKHLPRFRDVTDAVGLTAVHQAPVERISCNFAAGAAWGDIDGDGDLDLYLPHHMAPGQLWVNQGGTFTLEAAARGADNDGAIGLGAVFVDYDNDGDQDLYVTNDGPNRLYRNDGSGHFLDVAPAAGVDDARAGTSSSWADYDNDGLLDLYVVNYGHCGGTDIDKALVYDGDALYHNDGDGTFTDRTALLGPPEITEGAGFQAAWFDYDHDGDQDLYLANDFVGPRPRANVLWRNDGPDGAGGWRFTDVSAESQTGVSINSMGIGIGDFDRNGGLDVAVSNIRDNLLLRNNLNGTFTEVGGPAGVSRPYQNVSDRSITWGLAFFDLNLDSWEDLYLGAGSLGYETEIRPQPNEVFLNAGGGKFLDVSAASGADDPGETRGVAFADYDRDGRMDLYTVPHNGPVRLFRNVTGLKHKGDRYHWLEVDTVGTSSNRDGCGARLTARLAKGPTLVRQVFCGSISLASGSDSTVHFGLRSRASVKRLTIEWPSGAVQVLRKVKADRLITVTEPVQEGT